MELRQATAEANGRALLDVLEAIEQARRACRSARHDAEAAEHVDAGQKALSRAANVLLERLRLDESERIALLTDVEGHSRRGPRSAARRPAPT